MNKPNITLYVSDIDVVPTQAVEDVIRRDGFRLSTKRRMYEFAINIVGISEESALNNSSMDFECMLDHITDLDLEELAHEPVRMVKVSPVHNELRRLVSEVEVHTFTYHAPNSVIEVRYLYS
jgi:hypothetical protein